MAEWRDGEMAKGRDGGMVFYYIPNLSCYLWYTPTTLTMPTTPTVFKSFICTDTYDKFVR
jgi:hypothetical protein